MTSNETSRLAQLVEAVLDAEASNSEEEENTPPRTVHMHVRQALHAAQTPDVDAVVAAILDDDDGAAL